MARESQSALNAPQPEVEVGGMEFSDAKKPRALKDQNPSRVKSTVAEPLCQVGGTRSVQPALKLWSDRR